MTILITYWAATKRIKNRGQFSLLHLSLIHTGSLRDNPKKQHQDHSAPLLSVLLGMIWKTVLKVRTRRTVVLVNGCDTEKVTSLFLHSFLPIDWQESTKSIYSSSWTSQVCVEYYNVVEYVSSILFCSLSFQHHLFLPQLSSIFLSRLG